MSVEQNLPEGSTQDAEGRIDIDLHYAPKQRVLARLAYRLACIGPFAFVVRAMLYPVRETHAAPVPVQALFWVVALCSPCGAALGAVVFLLFRKRTLGYRKLSVGHANAGLVVGMWASLALLIGVPSLDSLHHGGSSHQMSCLSNVKQLEIGVLMYVQDYDDHYPLPKAWNDEIYPYTKNEAILHCPSAEEEKLPTYAMNGRLKNKVSAAVEKPDQTVMLFESIPGKNLAGGIALFPDPLRHSNGGFNTIGFTDGHAKLLPRNSFSGLIWTASPPAKPGVSSTPKGAGASR